MNRRGSALLALLGLWLALPVAAWAGLGVEYSGVKQIVIQQGLNGYDRVSDATIWSGAATTNYGAADTLKLSGSAWTGYESGQHRFALKFDVPAALHDSAVVVQAYVGLYQCFGNSGSQIDSVEVRRLGAPWNEGTGGNTGAVQPGNICWTNRYTGPTAWLSPGASSTSDYSTAPQQFAAQWASWSTGAATGDSAVINPGMCGTDTLFNGVGSFVHFDVARDILAISGVKNGFGQVNRQGWVFWDVSSQTRRWQIGSNEDHGFLFQFHNQTANRLVGFYSSNSTRKLNATSGYCYRPVLILRYILVGGSSSGTGTTVSNRKGVAILGPGAR